MKVKELIEELRGMPSNAEILVDCGEGKDNRVKTIWEGYELYGEAYPLEYGVDEVGLTKEAIDIAKQDNLCVVLSTI